MVVSGTNLDWFLPAIQQGGSVVQGFRAVADALTRKSEFIRCLNQNLSAYQGRSTDSITELRRRIREFDNTLTFRLGMLSPERPGAWFRPNMNQGTGPFGASVLSEPILNPYELKDLGGVETALAESYRRRTILPIPFSKKEPCLWLTLLSLNQCWEEVDVLSPPFRHLRISALPEVLPPDFESAALKAFLIRVKTSQQGAREEMDRCYAKLFHACEAFWDLQRASYVREQDKTRRSRGAQQKSPPVKKLADIRALQFMKFSDFPDPKTLKQRYRALAQELHPDRPGGCADAFHQLRASYSHLAGRIQES